MPLYRVTWEIDIDAETPREAAEIARAYQLNPNSTATVFDVFQAGTTPIETIDLQETRDEVHQAMKGAGLL